MAAQGKIPCEQEPIIERSHHLTERTVSDWRHYLAVIQRKPGALRNGSPFVALPEALRRLQGHLLNHPGGDRERVEILALVPYHDEQAVLCALEIALDAAVAIKTHILHLLHSLVDGKGSQAAAIDAQQVLVPRKEPTANVAHYAATNRRRAELQHRQR